jgi:Domain of unknown function (DUF5666)/Viral BACON domain/Putative binding domain, N-terminal
MWSRRTFAPVILAGAVASTTCSSTTSSVTSPTVSKCQIDISAQPPSFPATGGSGSLSIAATRDCTWSASADASWVALATTSGQGGGSLPFTVAANPAPSTRSGAITVSTARVTVTQAAAPCRFGLSRSQDTIDAVGGRLSVDVTTLAGCGWTASSAANWIGIQSGTSGNGNGTVLLSVAANQGPQRVGTATIAGDTYTITQSAATAAPDPMPPQPPSPTPNPTPPPLPPAAEPVEVSGSISSLSGHCPEVSFSIGRTHVTADASTNYRDGGCQDLRNKKKVSVTGVRDSDGTIRASRITLASGV